MKEIKLTNNQIALVDDEDYPLLVRHTWYAQKVPNTFYACTKTSTLGHIFMHRLICPSTKGKQVIDHINNNGLDNRKENLRLASWRENGLNNIKHRISSSLYKGVCKLKNGKWSANITIAPYKRFTIGTFSTELAAAMAYDLWAKDLYGEFAKLNFTPAI